MRLALAAFLLVPAAALAQEAAPLEPCTYLTASEVAAMVGADIAKVAMRSNTTSKGFECNFHGERQKALMTVEARNSKLPKYDLDQEAETLQKIYRTSLVQVPQVGDGAFWLPGKRELWFRKGKTIVRVTMPGVTGDAKVAEAKTASAARLIETRIK